MQTNATADAPALTGAEAVDRILSIMTSHSADLVLARGRDASSDVPPMLRSRPESTALMWFGAKLDPLQIAELESTAEVSIWLNGAGERALVTGRVLVTCDREVIDELWVDWWRSQFAGPGDPSLAIVIFMPCHAAYWDLSTPATRSFGCRFASTDAEEGWEPMSSSEMSESEQKEAAADADESLLARWAALVRPPAGSASN